VIQRLFAVGLTLQGTIPRAKVPEVQQRLVTTVDELQGVIQEIRTAIFDLHGGSAGSTRLRQRLDDAVGAFADSDVRITVQYVGPLSVIEAPLSDHAEAVVREGISNAVRHANADTVTVTVRVEDELAIDVVDDGCGMPDDVTPSGLINLRRRAYEVGGDFTVGNAPDGGTALRWTAPLP
jgi:signal transduction histidine kinase